jgi:hypothetical protein
MTSLQIMLAVPFAAFGVYTIINMIQEFKLMLHKGGIAEDVRIRRKRRFKIGLIALIGYFVYAFFVFFINYLLNGSA